MNRLIRFLLVVSVILQFANCNLLLADTGHEGATRIERGSYPEMRVVSISSTTGTNIFVANTKRPDGLCRNNSSVTVYVGTNTATTHGSYHANIVSGFPVLSSETFKLDGSFTGSLAATCDVGAASCEFRCLDGLVR